MDNQELDNYIYKFKTEKDIHLSVIDHLKIFNYLKELQMYRGVGTINDVIDLKGNYKTIKITNDLQEDIIQRLKKSNNEMANRIVKSERLINETVANDNDFTDDEFRGMLGYIIGYTSEGDEYKELRNALIYETERETGKDLTKCWIWM